MSKVFFWGAESAHRRISPCVYGQSGVKSLYIHLFLGVYNPLAKRERKKTVKKAIAIIMLAVFILGLLAACGGSKNSGGSGSGGNDPLLGIYKFSKMEDMTVQEYADLVGIDLEEAQKLMVLELKSGGTGTFSSDDDTESITWKVDGEKLILSAKDENGQDDTIEGTIKDGVVTLVFDDETVELVK